MGVSLYFLRAPLTEAWSVIWPIVSDREQCRNFIAGYGPAAPLVFMGLQIFQVIFAPIPGEATGIIGGYLFGTLKGFIYSTIALTAGSWMAFMIGRMLGKRFVRKVIPLSAMERFDFLVRHQGAVILFILFILPGFPKDYLCLFLGVSLLPLRVFMLMAAIGRMPGTLLLSIQGASIYDRDYTLSAVLFAVCMGMVFLAYRYREPLYRWIEKQNHGP